MLAHLVLVQAVNEADGFVGIDARQRVRELKDSLLEVVKHVPIMRILITVAQALLKHEVSLDDPGEPVAHLQRDESRDGFARC